uniref:Transmembrane protein 199 n=1 Tax=Cacopsylla melanoneura TaxID=428564 RepID=A0A8D8QM06_9HEMI
MVQQLKIKVNDKLKDVVQTNVQLGSQPNIPPNIETLLKSSTKHAKDKTKLPDIFLEIDDIKWLHAHVVGGLGDVFLHELISGEDIVLPEPEVLPRNPELEARIQRLKVQQMEREYRSMTKNVDSVRVNHPEDTISYQMKQINRQLIAVVQFIVSVGAGFTFGFIGVELIVGDLDFGFRLLLGVICALIIALAEIYFLAKKLADDLVPPLPPGEAGGLATASGGGGTKENVVKGKSHQD